MSNEAVEQVRSVVKAAGSQVQGKPGTDDSVVASHADHDSDRPTEHKEKLKKWKVWDLEFEAQMRMLDNAVSFVAYYFISLSYRDCLAGVPNWLLV